MAMIALLLASIKAYAQGNVLLPSANNNSQPLPNLGLIPAEPEPTPLQEPKPIPPPVVEEKQPELPAATNTPVPPVQNPVAPPYTQPIQPQQPRMPYTVTVALDSRSTSFTPTDIDTVSTQLGIPRAQVTGQCRMGINGMVVTDHGSSTIDGASATSANVAYDGSVTNAILSVLALCNSAPKPAPYNYIQRIGDKYGIAVGSVFCTPKVPFAGTMREIVITHTGTGQDSCNFVP